MTSVSNNSSEPFEPNMTTTRFYTITTALLCALVGAPGNLAIIVARYRATLPSLSSKSSTIIALLAVCDLMT